MAFQISIKWEKSGYAYLVKQFGHYETIFSNLDAVFCVDKTKRFQSDQSEYAAWPCYGVQDQSEYAALR